jgi:hypothetical protein
MLIVCITLLASLCITGSAHIIYRSLCGEERSTSSSWTLRLPRQHMALLFDDDNVSTVSRHRLPAGAAYVLCPVSCVTYIDLGLEGLNSGYSFHVVRVIRTNSLQKRSTMQRPSPLVFICCSTILPRPQCHKSDRRVDSQLFFGFFCQKVGGG